MRWLSEERGGAAVITVVCLMMLMAALVLTIDAGNVWQTRRSLITATDATAFAEARRAAIDGPGAACGPTWTETLIRNAGDEVEPISCRVETTVAPAGYVVVEARKPAAVRFGPALGLGDTSPYSMSAVKYGLISQSRGGLRPIGLCLDNEHVQGFLGTGVDGGYDPAPGVHRVYWNKEEPDACGDAPGNWGFMDLDGGSNSNTDLEDWIRNGYDGTVEIGDCDATEPTGDPCEGDTGASGCSLCGALQHLVDTQETFAIMMYDYGVVGSGGNARYDVYGFIGVRLVDFKIVGAPRTRYLDFEFLNITTEGNCCVPVAPDTGVYGMSMCTVDHDLDAELVRCGI